jgi:tRNA A-37 threonylcarbamoyl transferase component Bud32
MTVRQLSATTFSWVKEVSTNAFIKFGNRLHEIQFVQRNRKSIAIGLAIWLIAVGIGFAIYGSVVGRLTDHFYELGVTTTDKLAAASGSPLLEKDILSLNRQIGETGSEKGLAFAVIVDHKGYIVAHTDPSFLNQRFKPVEDRKHLDTIDTIRIEEGFLPNKEMVFSFVSDISYAGTSVGKAHVALSAQPFLSALRKYRAVFVSSIALASLSLLCLLVILDRRFQARALEKQRQLAEATRIGPYLLRERIGLGGMAEVFLADYVREDGFRKAVAVKRVLSHLAQNQNFIKMFIREARLAALLQHPNIVQILDFGKIDDSYFLAMEFVRGQNLAELMGKLNHGMDIDQAVFIISQVCMGLEHSHSKKDEKTGELLHIVHRDVSPQNILVSMQGEVKLNDFGISKANTEPSLTQAGVIRGKFSYLSPEQAQGETVDHRADIYALGVVFYEILSGKRLHEFANALEAMRTIVEKTILPIKELRPDIPEALDSVVMKCLEKDREARYQRAREVLEDLTRLRKDLNVTYDRSDFSRAMRLLFNPNGTI